MSGIVSIVSTPEVVGDKAETGVPIYCIVGDWVVDENWFLVRHYSELSKHTGDAHYRRLEGADGDDEQLAKQANKILDLCGTGHIARVLYEQRDVISHGGYKLLALGRWDAADQEYLTHLVHSGIAGVECNAGRLGYRLVPPSTCDEPVAGITLRTLKHDSPTIRAVRMYQRRRDGWHLVNRVDWEPPPQDGGIEMDALEENGNVRLIVLDDLQKGTVDDNLVQVLLGAYSDAKWYVRAKTTAPSWLPLLEDRLELFMVGPEVAPTYSPFERWHNNGRLTNVAIDLLNSVHARNVILLSEDREVVGKFTSDEGHVAIFGQSDVQPTAIAQVGWADAVMAGLVHHVNIPAQMTVRSAEAADGKGPHRKALPNSLVTSEVLLRALTVADQVNGVTGVPDAPVVTRQFAPPNISPALDWKEEERYWAESRSDLGIIDQGQPTARLEVWRSSSRLKDYIACVSDKLSILDEMGRHLRAFSRGRKERSVGILIQADPGTGKTHLARCLADAFRFELLDCDLAQMIHREEVFDFFDLLATRQANSDKPILVFVDEVNAPLEGSAAYAAFLAPLESGVYARRGRLFTLRPCVWVFTGTHVPEKSSEPKVSDFLSRMTMKTRIDYTSLMARYPGDDQQHQNARRDIEAAARLEQVYFGATMLNRYFPDVVRVEVDILRLFHEKEPSKAPFRDIRQLAASLRNVHHGRITRQNLPDSIGWQSSLKPPSTMETTIRLLFEPQSPSQVIRN